MKARIRKTASLVLATGLTLGSISIPAYAETETLAFASSESGKDIIVLDPTNSDSRAYDLYQVFNGELIDEEKLVNIDWGDSIAFDTDGDGEYDYDYSTKLVDALKDSKLPDGVTANPVASDFKGLIAINGKYKAEDVAGIIADYDSSDDSEKIDAVATIVGSIVTNNDVEKRTQDTKGTAISTGTQYTFAGVTDGYYMVSEVSNLTGTDLTYSKYMVKVGTGSKGTTIKAKASEAPTLEKAILDGDVLTDYQTVAISDQVTFELDSKVPNMDGYDRYYFIINDTLSKALDFNKIESITIGDVTLSETTDVNETDPSYELEKVKNDDGTTSLKIIFKNFVQYKSFEGKAIKVLYTADVIDGIISGETNKNTNTASLTYSNNPNYDYTGDSTDPDKPKQPKEDDPSTPEDESEPGDPTVTTPEDTVYVYTAGISIIKVDANGTRLNGATFKIVGEDTVSHMIKVVPEYTAVCYDTQADEYFKDGEQSYYKLLRNAYTADKYVADGNGATISRYAVEDMKFSAKDDGTYVEDINGDYIKTTSGKYVKASEKSDDETYEQGYVLYSLDETMQIVDLDSDHAVTGTVSTSNGIVTFDGLDEGTYTITEEEAPSGYLPINDSMTVTVSFEKPTVANEMKGNWEYSYTTTVSSTKSYINVSEENGVYEVQITNTKKHTLPSTGGIGTTIFYASGSVLAIAAAVLLIVKKRMHGENNE
jgi:fimbrial isopeptide formation D2 family protein/LPXTG-motif cell wall-anchored protein